MNTVGRIVRYALSDVLRSRWLLAYALFFLIASDGLLRFGGGDAKALLSLVNVVLFVIPLVSMVFGTVYVYDSREFTELLLAQPLRRGRIFAGLYLGLALPLSAAFAAATAIPFLVHRVPVAALGTLAALLATGTMLTLVFTALAFVVATRFDDRLRGLGIAIGTWLGLALLYDGAVLVIAATFAEYPLEGPMLGLMLANPVDLARVLLLLQFDVAALMGYTGAVFERFFGGTTGTIAATLALAAWVAVPVALGARAFRRKDF